MPLLRKTGTGSRSMARQAPSLFERISNAALLMDRRGFLLRAGLGTGAGMFARQLPLDVITPAHAQQASQAASGNVEVKHTVCSHCSVGCSVNAVVQNGVWVRQDTAFESPLNLGAHCAKGASVREHGHGQGRLRYPMKLVDGKYQRINWDQALNELVIAP